MGYLAPITPSRIISIINGGEAYSMQESISTCIFIATTKNKEKEFLEEFNKYLDITPPQTLEEVDIDHVENLTVNRCKLLVEFMLSSGV